MLQRIVRQVAMVFAVVATGCAAQAQSRMMRYPDVHEKRVVFTYEGDLWLGSTDGGLAR